MNTVILIGRLVADPELRQTPGGVNAATYRLAVQRPFANAQGKREADFISCVAWRTGADFAQKHLKKGMKIAVTGRIQTRSYDAQDGSKRYVCEVVVDSHEFCEKAEAAGVQPHPTEMQEVEDDELPF